MRQLMQKGKKYTAALGHSAIMWPKLVSLYNLPWWHQSLGFAHTIPTVPRHACPHLMNMLLDKIGVLWDLGLKFWVLEYN